MDCEIINFEAWKKKKDGLEKQKVEDELSDLKEELEELLGGLDLKPASIMYTPIDPPDTLIWDTPIPQLTPPYNDYSAYGVSLHDDVCYDLKMKCPACGFIPGEED